MSFIMDDNADNFERFTLDKIAELEARIPEVKRLSHELRSFKNQLKEHNTKVELDALLRQFFSKKGQRINVYLVADTCASRVSFSINGVEVPVDSGDLDICRALKQALLNNA